MGEDRIPVVIPAAGRGTRFGEYTKFIPKEMFLVKNKPLIYWALKEAFSSGFRHVIIVIHKEKKLIKDYVLKVFSNKRRMIDFVYQPKRLGIGDALLQAKPLVRINSFFMLIPDQFLYRSLPGRKLIQELNSKLREMKNDVVLSSLIAVHPEERRYFSTSRSFKIEKTTLRNIYKIKDFSRRDVIVKGKMILGLGRTLFPTKIFKYFSKENINPLSGEVDLLLSFQKTFKEFHHYGVLLKGCPLDFGSCENYLYFSKIVKKGLLE